MGITALSTEENKRVRELKNYNILDTISEVDYDGITLMASLICDVPISLISFIDKDRQWFKSHRGLTINETIREYSFCSHALAFPEDIMIVPDLTKDARFQNNPFVKGDPKIIFYAGVPLVNKNGYGLGTVCVIDSKPRELTKDQLAGLVALAAQVINLLEMRRTNVELEKVTIELEKRNTELEQFAMVVSHDIKTPLASLLISNEILKTKFTGFLGKDGSNMLSFSTNSALKIKSLVDGILSYYKEDIETDIVKKFSLTDFFTSLEQVLVFPKPFHLQYNNCGLYITWNKTKLEQVFLNLLSNSIRYNDKPVAEIRIDHNEDDAFHYFSVTDNGKGIAKENQQKVFELFTTLSKEDALGNKGLGIGLPTVKKIIEAYEGSITISSEIGAGCCFSFKIKKLSLSKAY